MIPPRGGIDPRTDVSSTSNTKTLPGAQRFLLFGMPALAEIM
jgi:hypothetical protein